MHVVIGIDCDRRSSATDILDGTKWSIEKNPTRLIDAVGVGRTILRGRDWHPIGGDLFGRDDFLHALDVSINSPVEWQGIG